jgi:hypothetical protein
MNIEYFIQKGNAGNPSGLPRSVEIVHHPQPCIPSGMQPVHLDMIHFLPSKASLTGCKLILGITYNIYNKR